MLASHLYFCSRHYVWSGFLTCDILSCTVNDFIALFKQVWNTENVSKKLRDIPIPFNDVNNILDEIHFEDEVTRSRCRGWLVAPSRKYLLANILFPGCEFDCSLTIRGRTGTTHFQYDMKVVNKFIIFMFMYNEIINIH